jgi:hypothetical protein
MRLRALSLLLLLATIVPGCSAPKAKDAPDALANLKKSLAQENEGAFVACFEESKDYVIAIQKLYATVQQTREYEKEMLDRDGPDALKSTGGKNILQRLDDWLQDATFTQEGEQATCVLKDGQTRFTIRTEEGSWVINSKEFVVLFAEQVVAAHIADLGGPPPTEP